jgi:post-segregation antitoxin (ccd killing protein)
MGRPAAAQKKTETDPHKLDIDAIAKEALAYALRRGRRLAWRSGNARMATLAVAEDAVAEAVASLFAGETRKWNPAKVPDARQHVRSSINSILWNRAISSEEKAKPLEGRALLVPEPSDPEMLLLAKEEARWQKQLEDQFIAQVLEDPELLAVYTAIEQLETDKPAQLANHLNLPVREIDGRKRKLRALMSKVFQELTMDRAEGEART